eukprot:TRINITY_DN20998_c0_g1_i3.p1 TRINITY_DN20998_c0_g1~~TRINITY_DN20998_c0_g1_i3.p1  ORF type:complete len:1042 (-),score=199.33 TRINITY_DN20998_c0_g1_i3:476-3454(-)
MPNSANHPLNTPLSSFHKCVCLEDWWLVKAESDCNGKRLAVGGLTSKGHQAKRVFYSSPIIKRNDAYTLETTDGIIVIIQGLINRARSNENGFPPEVCNKFLIGFPLNWEVYSDLYLGKESVSTQTSSSCLDELSTPSADIANTDPPTCFDELPVSRVLDCLISTHGSSDNDTVRGTEILGNCSASASRNSMSRMDMDMRNIIPFLMDSCLLEENPSKHEMFNGDQWCGDISKETINGRRSRNIKNDVPEENRKTLLSKEPENLNHGSFGDHVDDVFEGNKYMEKSGNPSIDAWKHCSMQTAERFISPCMVGKSMHKEIPNNLEMARTSDLLNISKSVDSEENESCLNDKITSNANEIGCEEVEGEFFPKASDPSNLKGGKKYDKRPKISLKSGSTEFQSISVFGDLAPDRVRLVSEILCDQNNSDAANVDSEEIVRESTSVDTSNELCNDSVEMKNCTYIDANSPTSQTGNNKKIVPSVMGLGMQNEALTRDTCGAARAITRLRNLTSNQKKNQTSDHSVNNEDVLSSSSVTCVSQNDGSIYYLNAGGVPNVSNLGPPDVQKDLLVSAFEKPDLFVIERDNGYREYDKEPRDEIPTGKLSKGKTGCGTSVTSEVTLQTCNCDHEKNALSSKSELNILNETSSEFGARRSSRRLKNAKNNLKDTRNVGIEKNEVRTGNCAANKRSREIEKNDVSPRKCAEKPESRRKFISTETDDRHIECGQESRHESRELFTENASLKGKVHAGSDVITVFPSEEKVETSERILRKSDPKTMCSTLKQSNRKQDQDQTMKDCPQTEKREAFMSKETMNIKHKKSGESALGFAKAALGNRMVESSPEKIDNGQHECGIQLDHLSCQHGVHANVQKGSNLSVKMLKVNDKANDSSQKNVMMPEFTSYKGSDLSVKKQKSNDKVKGSRQKSNATKPHPYQLVTRNRAKKLSLVSPESLNFKRSRSGRLLVPPLANWRNEQIIYDQDGVITGITLGNDDALPSFR